MFEWFDLEEGAAILTDAMGKPVGARDLLKMAFAGELKVASIIPGWESPGDGDLVFYSVSDTPAGARMTSVTDGFFRHLGTQDFQTLRNHGRLPLAGKVVRLPDSEGAETDWVIGPDAPTITLGDLRVSAAEIERILEESAPVEGRQREDDRDLKSVQQLGEIASASSALPAPDQTAADPRHHEEAGTAVDEPQQDDGASPVERIRADEIGIEIDDAIAALEKAGKRVTATTVMALLKAKAGRSDSCVIEVAADGVVWIRGTTGKPEKLTMEALKKRIGRTKKGR